MWINYEELFLLATVFVVEFGCAVKLKSLVVLFVALFLFFNFLSSDYSRFGLIAALNCCAGLRFVLNFFI